MGYAKVRQLLRDHDLRGFFRRRGRGMVNGMLVAVFLGFLWQLASSSVAQVKEDTLGNRKCLQQLFLGGNYTNDPDCQYPRKGYDSLVDELAALSNNERTQSLVINCILQLHVQENMPVPMADIVECQREALEAAKSGPIQDAQQPTPQPNQKPEPSRSSGASSPGNGNGGGSGNPVSPGQARGILNARACVSEVVCLGGRISP